MNAYMWRQIFFMAFYQILVMVILMYFGGLMFDYGEGVESVNLIASKLRKDDMTPEPRLILDTMLFHTFILINLFN